MAKLLDQDNGNPGPTPLFALFQNLETQGAALTWAWKGQIYTYEDGKVYEMSQEQIDHLNSLSVMTYKEETSEDGQLKTVPATRRHRFSVRVMTGREVAKIRDEMQQVPANQ